MPKCLEEMSNKKFFQLSDKAKDVKDFFVNSDTFYKLYKGGVEVEWNSTMFHYLFDNVPYAFRNIPLLYENVKQYLAMRLDVHPDDIRLVGSAQLGFSLDPNQYGKEFTEKSDLDFVVVNEHMFHEIEEDALRWCEDYEKGVIHPGKNYRKSNWDSNRQVIPNNLDRGFVDIIKVPSFERYPKVKKVYDLMTQLQKDLLDFQQFKISHSSVRVYKDIPAFYGQAVLNANHAMDRVDNL